MKFDKVLNALLAVIGIGWMFLHLVLIRIYGEVRIYEHNPLIINAEVIIVGTLFLYTLITARMEAQKWTQTGKTKQPQHTPINATPQWRNSDTPSPHGNQKPP